MAALPSGWVELGGMPWWRRLWALTSTPQGARLLAGACVLDLGAQILTQKLLEAYGWASVLWFLVLLLLIPGVTAIIAARYPPPQVNFDTDQLRTGGDVAAFSEITEAQAVEVPLSRRTDWYLMLAAPHHRHVLLCVRSTKLPELGVDDRAMVAEVLRRSCVRIPSAQSDPFDPRGKFAWMDHPNHLDRDDAIEYVLNTPRSGMPRRTPPPRRIWSDES